MPKLQDYCCEDCSEVFETWDSEPVCPDCGGGNLEVVFITPRATQSIKTQNADNIAKDLVAGAGKTDWNNNPHTNHQNTPQVFQSFSAKNTQEFNRNINAAVTAKVQQSIQGLAQNGAWQPKGGMNLKPINDMRDVPTAGDTINQIKKNRIHPRQMMNVIASVDKNGNLIGKK